MTRLEASLMHSAVDRVSEFKDTLRHIMIMKNITQSELAIMTGTTQGMISHFLSGRRTPSYSSLRLIVESLDVDANIFF